jgi:hypothetical protein
MRKSSSTEHLVTTVNCEIQRATEAEEKEEHSALIRFTQEFVNVKIIVCWHLCFFKGTIICLFS